MNTNPKAITPTHVGAALALAVTFTLVMRPISYALKQSQ